MYTVEPLLTKDSNYKISKLQNFFYRNISPTNEKYFYLKSKKKLFITFIRLVFSHGFVFIYSVYLSSFHSWFSVTYNLYSPCFGEKSAEKAKRVMLSIETNLKK